MSQQRASRGSQRAAATDEARNAALRGQHFWSGLSYPHRQLAATMLMKYWPGDETLVESALRRMADNTDANSPWEHDFASAYLMESPLDRADVRAWILAELDSNFPFAVLVDKRIWSQVGRFAAVDSEIRAAATVSGGLSTANGVKTGGEAGIVTLWHRGLCLASAN